MKIHSLVLVALLLPIVPAALFASDDIYDAAVVFERGLSVGVDAVEREYRVQGWKKEEVEVLNYMVVLDAKNISTKRLLLLKDFGFRRGLAPIELSNNTLLYKSFDNAADAYELAKYLNDAEFKEIKEKVYVYKKRQGEHFTKAPFAFKYIFDQMQKEIKEDVQVVVLNPAQAKKIGVYKQETIYEQVPAPVKVNDQVKSKPPVIPQVVQPVVVKVPEPTPEKVKVVKPIEKQPQKVIVKQNSTKPIKDKHIKLAKAFHLKGGSVEMFTCSDAGAASDELVGKKFTNSMFSTYDTVKNKGQMYRTTGSIVTSEGVRYVKVEGKNIYFDVFNTSLGK